MFSHLELHNALVVLGSELWVLEKWVLHVNQVPLICGVAVQDKRHLGDHWWLQGQFSQWWCGALDGSSVLTVHTTLESREERSQTMVNIGIPASPRTEKQLPGIRIWSVHSSKRQDESFSESSLNKYRYKKLILSLATTFRLNTIWDTTCFCHHCVYKWPEGKTEPYLKLDSAQVGRPALEWQAEILQNRKTSRG